MIKKIVKLKNVGKYKNYSFSGGTENDFGSVSLIYGENTYGKSTLTTVFKSLKTWNKDYIYGRKTFGSTDIQEVEILIDGKITKLSDADFGNDNIEIFDNDFVSRNVFYGDEIGKNQQGNLYEIFLDENIKKDRLEIDDLKTKKETLEKDKKEYIFQNYKLPIKIEDFEKIKENLKVDDDIKTKSVELKQVNNIAEIAKLLASNLFLYDFTGLTEAFLKTLDTSIEYSITSHLNENLNDIKNGKNFIATGLGLLKSDNCVFCGQKLDEEALKLIENYRKIFSKTYEDLKNEIKQKGDKFLNIDFEKEILKFANLEIVFDGVDLQKFYDYKKNIDAKIKEKQIDLNKVLDFLSDGDFIEFEKIYDAIKLKVNTLKSSLENPKNVVDLEKELSFLKNQKIRFEKNYIDLFIKISTFDKSISDLKVEIDAKNIELGKKVENIFKENLGNINDFLKRMNATFHLKDLKAVKNMTLNTSHYCDYSFVFNDTCEVKISNKQNQKDEEKDNLPHFKNTLSDSEKRTLAFTFFLSKLKNDKKLEDKIIILDDPFSSFDENRKEKTIQLFRDINNTDGKLPKQKIILTHEKGFFSKCYNEFPKDNLKTFKISHSLASGSLIVAYDEDEFLTEEYFENLKYIKKSYENSSQLTEALKKARPCLEHILKRKYFFCLEKNELSSKSITTYLDKIGTKCGVRNDIINLNLHEEMHDNHPTLQLNETEKVSKLGEFLLLIEKI